MASVSLAACATLSPGGPVGNRHVPEPAKPVDLHAYAGTWFEMVRYENGFEHNCEGVAAEYSLLPDGSVSVVNTCHLGELSGPIKISREIRRSCLLVATQSSKSPSSIRTRLETIGSLTMPTIIVDRLWGNPPTATSGYCPAKRRRPQRFAKH